MAKRIYQILLLILFAISLDSQSSGGKKKLYLSKINVMAGVPDVIRNSIVNRIKLNVIEKFGDKYYIVSDSDVALMNQKAAQLQKQGCSDEVCMKQIADAIDADEIVYGDVLKEGEKIKFQFTNINRDKNTFSMTTKSIAEIAFFESQYDHFVREATFKLIDPKYKINLNVEIKSDDTISVKTINLAKVDGLDLSLLDFKSDDSSVSNILDYLKDELRLGDSSFTKKSYKEARVTYQKVLEKIQVKLTKEKRSKIKSFEESVVDRIGSTHVMSIKEEWIEYYDNMLSQMKNPKESQLKEIFQGYQDTELEMDKIPNEYQKKLANLRKGLEDRMENLALALIGSYETRGDNHYKENQFEEAYKLYVDGKALTAKIKDSRKKEFENKLIKKIEITRKTRENYVKNTVRTYLDQAEYLNIQDKVSNAKSSLELAKKAMKNSIFTPSICQEWYMDTSLALGVSDSIEKKSENLKDFEPKRDIFSNSIKMIFVRIPAGTFLMGCSIGDTECADFEKPQHKVMISNSYYLGKFEVTQEQWKTVMGNNSSYFSNCGDNCPVERVSWDDVQQYIQRLCKIESMNPCKYRLPTEAEWEYAARAGSTTELYNGKLKQIGYFESKNLDQIGWFAGNSKVNYTGGFNTSEIAKLEGFEFYNYAPYPNIGTQVVGKKEPNAWGLYDMLGNVWEWVEDKYDNGFYNKTPYSDPVQLNGGTDRITRGCSWNSSYFFCRTSARFADPQDYRLLYNGFRLVYQP